jgi:signal transduction histidine kinase
VLDRVSQWFVDNTFLPEWQWLPRWLRHPWSGFVLAALLQVGAALITLGLVVLLPMFSYVGTLELLVVALIALSFGAGPSLAATLFGAILLEWFVLPERTAITHISAASLMDVSVLVIVGVVLSVVASQVEQVRRRAERAQAEAQARELAAREASRHLDAFLGIAGHELRSPLTTMLATIQLVERRLRRLSTSESLSPQELDLRIEPINMLLSRAERQVQVQNRLVGDLLDVSRIEANRLELRAQTFDLAALVSDVVEEQRLAWPARDITLEVPEALSVPADPDRIGQVVTNYLTNALKYSPADQPVHVTLTQAERIVRLAVRDRGPGLPPAEQQRIWQRFHRAEGVQVLDGGGVGLGLGLHISRTIIERHGGEVGVCSAPGKGATFWFTLPCDQSSSAEQVKERN